MTKLEKEILKQISAKLASIDLAEDFIDPNWCDGDQFDRVKSSKIMIAFAKLHLEAQKAAIKKELEEGLATFGISLTDDFKLEQTGNNLIDEAYSLDNVK